MLPHLAAESTGKNLYPLNKTKLEGKNLYPLDKTKIRRKIFYPLDKTKIRRKNLYLLVETKLGSKKFTWSNRSSSSSVASGSLKKQGKLYF